MQRHSDKGLARVDRRRANHRELFSLVRSASGRDATDLLHDAVEDPLENDGATEAAYSDGYSIDSEVALWHELFELAASSSATATEADDDWDNVSSFAGASVASEVWSEHGEPVALQSSSSDTEEDDDAWGASDTDAELDTPRPSGQ